MFSILFHIKYLINSTPNSPRTHLNPHPHPQEHLHITLHLYFTPYQTLILSTHTLSNILISLSIWIPTKLSSSPLKCPPYTQEHPTSLSIYLYTKLSSSQLESPPPSTGTSPPHLCIGIRGTDGQIRSHHGQYQHAVQVSPVQSGHQHLRSRNHRLRSRHHGLWFNSRHLRPCLFTNLPLWEQFVFLCIRR